MMGGEQRKLSGQYFQLCQLFSYFVFFCRGIAEVSNEI